MWCERQLVGRVGRSKRDLGESADILLPLLSSLIRRQFRQRQLRLPTWTSSRPPGQAALQPLSSHTTPRGPPCHVRHVISGTLKPLPCEITKERKGLVGQTASHPCQDRAGRVTVTVVFVCEPILELEHLLFSPIL